MPLLTLGHLKHRLAVRSLAYPSGGAVVGDPKVSAPKQGDRVTSSQHTGTYEVVGVNALMQTANLRSTDGNAPVIPNVAWAALKPLGKR